MPAVMFHAYKQNPPRQSPLTLHPVNLQPALEFSQAGFNLVSDEDVTAMKQNPYFAQIWQELQDSGVVEVLDIDKGNPANSEPDLTALNLTQAVNRVKATTSLAVLNSWKDLDYREGVQRAIAAQIDAISPLEPPKPTTTRTKGQS